MCVFAYMYLNVLACSAHRDEKKASDPPGLELQTLLSCHLDTGYKSQDLYKSSKCYGPLEPSLQYSIAVTPIP